MKNIKKSIIKFLLMGFIITNLMAIPYALAAGDQKDDKKAPVTEKKEILIKYKDEAKGETVKSNLKNKLKLNKLELKKKTKIYKIELLEIDEKDNLDSVINELKQDPNVAFVQQNYQLNVSTIDDPMFNMQWALLNTAQDVGGVTGRAGVDINAQAAWNITEGSSTVVVGVLDTGIDIFHKDLKDNIFVNTKEIPGDGIDNDNNGKVDDINGWDFANNDNQVYDDSEFDAHGTYVAGIIGAKGNTEGIRGVAPNVKILPMKFINGVSGYTCDAIDAIEYGYQMGVKIINCSFGGTDDNPVLKDIMQNSGILFVCAAGNRNADVSLSPIYPACFDIPNVLSVGAINSNGMKASFSNFGSKVHVAAPGVNILSTVPGDGYQYLSGTSGAVSHVTGIAALVKSQVPEVSASDLIARIKNNVVVCASLQGKVTTGGRVDAQAALTNIPPAPDNTPPAEDDSGQPADTGEEETNDDSLYTLEQLNLINEQIHYGENGIQPAIGNFSFTCNDMSMNSPGFQINISRTYNSKDDINLEKRDRHLGKGWSFGFEGNINKMGYIKVALPNGSVQTFNPEPGNKFTAQDSRSTLEKNDDGTYVLTTKDRYSYGFSKEGWLTSMTDRNGNTITIDVDASTGKINFIRDAVGREFTVTYNGYGYIDTIMDPAGRTVKYKYDTNKRLVKVIDPENNVSWCGYDAQGFLDKVYESNKDENTIPTNLLCSLKYDHKIGAVNQDKVIEATDAFGNKYTYNYDIFNRKTTITDSNNRQTVNLFDSSNYLVDYQDEEGRHTLTVYSVDAQKRNKYGEVHSTTDRNGNTTIYDRDVNGNVTKLTNADISEKNYKYDDKNNLIEEKDEMGKRTFYIYDTNKVNLLRKVQPLNGTDDYDDAKINDQVYRSNYAITEYSYYEPNEQGNNSSAKGLIKTVTDPEDNVTTYGYDVNGYANSTKDPENKETLDVYNNIGWKLSTLTPKKYTTAYKYDNNGLVEKVTQHGGEVTRTTYDQMGRKTQEISPKQYDPAKDDIASHKYNDISVGTRYTYYYYGKIKTVTDAEGNTTSYFYDKYGNIETETKPDNSIYIYEYDAMNRIKKVFFKKNKDAASEILEEYSYAILPEGKTKTTHIRYLLNDNDKAQTVYIYDYAGRLIQQENPDGSIFKTEYNTNGTVKSTTDGNGYITCYNYDGLNRQTEKWVQLDISGEATKYAYSRVDYYKNGNKKAEVSGIDKVALYSMPSKVITKNFTYYKNGKIKSISDSEGRLTEYLIDDDGNVTKETVKVSGSISNVTDYDNNYLNKIVWKEIHVRAGDIGGNDFTTNDDMILRYDYTYDKNGNLETEKTPDNVTTTYTYDNLNRMTGVSKPGLDETGATVIIITKTNYNWEGNILTTEDAKTNKTINTYNERGFLTQVEDANHGITYYEYDRAGRKILEVSPENYILGGIPNQMNRVEYTYDSMGRLKKKFYIYKDPVTQQNVTIVSKAMTYDKNGNLIMEQDALGYQNGYGTSYTYDGSNRVLTVTDPVTAERALSYTTKYEYDGAGRKISETNAKGVSTIYTYDHGGNILTVSLKKPSNEAERLLKRNTYDLVGNIFTQTDGNENTTKFDYNALNKVRKTETPGDDSIDSNIITCQYDLMGNLANKQDLTGKLNEYTYDHEGRVLTQTEKNAFGTDENTIMSITTSYRYDVNGNKRFETDGNGNTKEYHYDVLNRLDSTKITVSGVIQETKFDYDKNGNLRKQTDWRNNTFENVYDPMNRLIAKKDPFGKTIQTLKYYDNGVQSQSYDALNYMTEYYYDKNNRLLTTKDPEGHEKSQSYDDVGNINTKTDGNTVTVAFQYDEQNRLKSVTNAKGETTGYDYDLYGNLLAQTDGKGNKTTFQYNAANKLATRIDPNGKNKPEKTETYTYYPDGSIKSKQDRNGNTTNYTYDKHGRLTNQYISSNTITYTYDNNGNQLTMVDNAGTTQRTYDALNRVLTKTVPIIGTSIFTYDIVEGMEPGEKAETSLDPSANFTKKIYDRAGRLKKVITSEGPVTYQYYDNGSRESVIYPDGSKEEYTYYRDGLNDTLTNTKSDGSILETYKYTYDGAHNQKTKTDAKGITNYDYDCLNRLEKVTEPGGKITTYTFDAAGNRLTETVTKDNKTILTYYTYNEQNRLLKTETQGDGIIETVTFTCDNNGNMLSTRKETLKLAQAGQTSSVAAYKAGTNLESNITFCEYDVWNQMVKTIAADKTVTMAYNGDGLRVEKTINGDTTRYLYQYDKVVLETDGSGNQKAKNVYGLNLLMRNVGGESYYYMYNGHGDVTALLGTNGNIAATYYYDAFGNITEQTGNLNNNITYAGYQYDKETGMYYLNARMYDPKIARFLQEDTYRGDPNDPLSLNLYTYCHNEPIMYTDPDGHDVKNIQLEKTEGKDKYISKNGKIYKNNIEVPKENYKYVPSAIGGTRDSVRSLNIQPITRLSVETTYAQNTVKNPNPSPTEKKPPVIKNVQTVTRLSVETTVPDKSTVSGLSTVNNQNSEIQIKSTNDLSGKESQGTGNHIVGVANTVSAAAAGTQLVSSAYINKVMSNGNKINPIIDTFAEGNLTTNLVQDAKKALNSLEDVRVLAPAKNFAGSINNLKNVAQTAGPIFDAAGKVVKIATPIIEAPNSWDVYKNLVPDNASTTEKSLAVLGATGDAVSFGFLRSFAKTPTLVTLIPGVPDDWADDYNGWVNRNVNGVGANKVIDYIINK